MLQTLWNIMQSSKLSLVMGHIMTGLALYFRAFDPKVTNMCVLQVCFITKDFLF